MKRNWLTMAGKRVAITTALFATTLLVTTSIPAAADGVVLVGQTIVNGCTGGLTSLLLALSAIASIAEKWVKNPARRPRTGSSAVWYAPTLRRTKRGSPKRT